MKLSTAAIILASGGSILKDATARSTVSQLGGINLFPQANFDVEVDAAHANSADGLGSLPLFGRRDYGMASLRLALLSHIQQTLGTDLSNAAALGEANRVQTLRLMETSPWHTDCEMDGTQKRTSPEKDELQVSFFFSNTNEDAYFETKDGNLCIPVVEGNFVSFNGRVPHRSVVMSGHIDMVGPFSLSSDGFVDIAMLTDEKDDAEKDDVGYGYYTTSGGDVVGCGLSRRQLSAVNGSNIEGSLVMGDIAG